MPSKHKTQTYTDIFGSHKFSSVSE